ncbi:MAG: FadR/GntR family transcriptional regulator [Xanthobacteraceae bacterium]
MNNTQLLPAVDRRSLVASVIDILRSKVRDGTWRVADRIPAEAELAEAFGVGRNTVREAIRVLSHSGMLEVRQGDGTYVRRAVDPAETIQRINRSSLRDHLEMQSILEAEAARFAARRRTQLDIEALKKTVASLKSRLPGEDLEAYMQRDRAFHIAVATAAHNQAIEELYRYFALAVHTHALTIQSDGELAEPSYEAHWAIVDAIIKQDEERAANAARNILTPRITRLSEIEGK